MEQVVAQVVEVSSPVAVSAVEGVVEAIDQYNALEAVEVR